MFKAKVVNLFAGPGAGKSTISAGVFFELKMAGVDCELSREYAKDKVWEKNDRVFENQAYIFGKQLHRNLMPGTEVDILITDSPLILSAVYNNNEMLGKDFNDMVVKVFNAHDNINYFINRKKAYNPNGRFQTEEGAKEKDKEVKAMLDNYGIAYKEIDGTREGMYTIVNDILSILGKPQLVVRDTEEYFAIMKQVLGI